MTTDELEFEEWFLEHQKKYPKLFHEGSKDACQLSWLFGQNKEKERTIRILERAEALRPKTAG